MARRHAQAKPRGKQSKRLETGKKKKRAMEGAMAGDR